MAQRFVIARDAPVSPIEIMSLQVASGSTGWGVGCDDHWKVCIEQSLCIATAWDQRNALVGIGFLVGNVRHAEPVDIVVDPQVRRNGIGRRLVEELLAFAGENQIRYVNLIRDPSQPWLKEFYERIGFRDITFAMAYEALASQPLQTRNRH